MKNVYVAIDLSHEARIRGVYTSADNALRDTGRSSAALRAELRAELREHSYAELNGFGITVFETNARYD